MIWFDGVRWFGGLTCDFAGVFREQICKSLDELKLWVGFGISFPPFGDSLAGLRDFRCSGDESTEADAGVGGDPG